MLQIKYFVCLRSSMKTPNKMSGILMRDMKSPFAKL